MSAAGHKQRRLGQTADPRLKPLLSQVGGKLRQTSRPKSPEDIHAPPRDSDDDLDDSETLSESDQRPPASPLYPNSSDDDSRGNITKIGFQRGNRATSQEPGFSSGEKKPKLQRGQNLQTASSGNLKREKRGLSDSEDEIASSQQSTVSRPLKKKGFSAMKSEAPTEDMDLLVGRYSTNKSSMKKYGKAAQKKRPIIKARSVPKTTRKLIAPKDITPSPERAVRGIIRPPSMSPDPERKGARLIVPTLSPAAERAVPAIKASAYYDDSPPSKSLSPKRFDFALPSDSDFGWPSGALSDDKDELAGGLPPGDYLPKTEETCPMCYQRVDRDLLRDFSGGKPLAMRQQMKFCNLHKARSAEDTWRKRGYPSIDWSVMGGRLKRYHKLVRRIIDGEESHYRTDLAEKLETGQERTLRKTERSLAPGYYGNRGLRLMSEHIIQHFSETLRERAVDDWVISGRGTTVFVSKVLVPELATRLIMEDMSVDISEARHILLESVDMGDLLHDDVADGEIDAVVTMDDSRFGSVDDVFAEDVAGRHRD